MSYDIGPKIGIEGEAEFKKALSQVNTNLKTLGTEMQAVTSAFDKNDRSAESLTAQNEVLNKQIDEQKSKLEMLKAKLTESATEYGENDAKTQKWQQAVNKATAELNGMERQLNNNNAELEQTATAGDKAGGNLKNAGDKAKQSGDDAEQGKGGWSKLGSGLAEVGEYAAKAIAALGAAATAAGTALVAMSVSGASYADDVMTISAQTGIATDKLQEYKYAAELVDVSTETLTKSMAKNIKSMSSAAGGTGATAEAYKKLGVAVTNSDGSMRDGQTVYWEAIDALGKMDNETERDALAMQILGKSAQELNPLIEAGSERMQELAGKAQAAGYVLSEDTLEAFGAFDDQLQFLKVGAEAAKNALGTILLPTLTELAGDGTELLGQFTNGILGANGGIEKMGEVIGSTLSSLVNKIVERLPGIVEAGMDIISALGQGLMDNLPAIVTAAVEIITMLAGGLVDALPQLVEAALQIILALATGLADALPELIPSIVETVLTIVNTLIDNVDMLVDAAIAIIMALAAGLIDALPTLMEKAPEIVSKLVTAIIENAPKLLAAAGQLVATLVQGIVENLSSLGETAAQVVNTIVSGIGSLISDIWEVGKDVVRGIWEGIKSMTSWLWDRVKGFFSGILDGVKDFLGIHSPSKVFAGIGENMAAGLGLGFADQMKSVAKQIESSVPTSFSTNVTPVGGGSERAVSQITQNVIINSPTQLLPSQIARESKNALRRLCWA